MLTAPDPIWEKPARLFSVYPMAIILLALILLIPALFINLGLFPLISDEPTRAVVALEMVLSGNYINPTIMGEFYYNKPPLYNWLLIAFTAMSSSMNEFTLRLPTVLSLLAYAWVIYSFSKSHLGNYYAFLAALFTITSARILFWDSSHALIDITYALVTFSSFTLLWYFSKKEQFTALFTSTYALTALGFLMKGMPSLAFQGISLLVWFSFSGNFKKLFSFRHLLGVFVLIFITGSYYLVYLQTNSIDEALRTLISESNRLKAGNGLWLWLVHLFTFPFEMIYEFAPWSLLILLLLKKSIRRSIFGNSFYRFCTLIFLSNIILYWLSADMRARYVFMLFPLVFIISLEAFRQLELKKPDLWLKIARITALTMMFVGILSLWVYPFWSETQHIRGVYIVTILSSVLAMFITYSVIKTNTHHLAGLVVVLLLIRVSFNLFNVPARLQSYPDKEYRDGEIKAGQLARNQPVYVWKETPFNHDAAFYVGRESGKIVRRADHLVPYPAFYIMDEKNLSNFGNEFITSEVLHTFSIKLNETRLFMVFVEPE